MKIKYHVYIPSRGRADNCLTAMRMQESNIPFTIMVEPAQYADYAEFYPKENLHKLPRNDRGLSYARNQIKKLSTKKGEVCHWQMDDDIRKFMMRRDNKNVKITARESLEHAEAVFRSYTDLSMLSHRYTAFAFAQKEEFSFNQNACSCILVRNSLEAKWKDDTIEDADFAMRVLTAGGTTITLNRNLIDTVPHLAQKGGLTDAAMQGNGRKVYYQQLAEDWPGAFSVKVDDTGKAKLIHHRVWSKFKQRPTPIKRKRVQSK